MKTIKLMTIKYILLGLLFLAPIIKVNAQNPDTSLKQFDYCQLMGMTGSTTNLKWIKVDFGEDQTIYKSDEIKLITEEISKSKTMIDALNVMNKKGWELVQAYGYFVVCYPSHVWVLKKPKNNL